MNTIYESAIELACEQKTVIVRLDIQFNYKTQTHTGYLSLDNDHEYHISAKGWIRINV